MKKINETFTCINCGKLIPLASKTCRNHCPFCFVSLHVDWDVPWDRNSSCKWKMFPREYFLSNWKIKILFECETCHKKHRNKVSMDDDLHNVDAFIKKYKSNFV